MLDHAGVAAVPGIATPEDTMGQPEQAPLPPQAEPAADGRQDRRLPLHHSVRRFMAGNLGTGDGWPLASAGREALKAHILRRPDGGRLSIARLAREAGLQAMTVKNFLAGFSHPRLETGLKLAAALHCSPWKILEYHKRVRAFTDRLPRKGYQAERFESRMRSVQQAHEAERKAARARRLRGEQ